MSYKVKDELLIKGPGYVVNNQGSIIGRDVEIELDGSDEHGLGYIQNGIGRLKANNNLYLISEHSIQLGYLEEVLPVASYSYFEKPGEPGVRYISSEVKGDRINIYSKGDVIISGSRIGSIRGLYVEGDNIYREKISSSYVNKVVWGVSSRSKRCKRILGMCYRHVIRETYGWSKDMVHVSLESELSSLEGEVYLSSRNKLLLSGDIISFSGISLLGKEILLDAVERYTHWGYMGYGDDLQQSLVLNILGRSKYKISGEDLRSEVRSLISWREREGLSSVSNYVGSGGAKGYDVVRLVSSGKIEIKSAGQLTLRSPLILGDEIYIESIQGDIIGTTLFSNYIDEIILGGVIRGISGRRGVLSGLSLISIKGSKGNLYLEGMSLSSGGDVEILGNSISITGSHHTVLQFYEEIKRKWLFSRKRKVLDSHSVVYLPEITGKHLYISGKDITLAGSQISVESLEITNYGLGKIDIADYLVEHYYKEERKIQGIKLPGMYGSLLKGNGRNSYGERFVNNVPLLSSAYSLLQIRSITDLGPAMKLGGEILDIFTSGDSLGELLRGQLGVTDNYLPKGISYVKRKQLLEFQEYISYSSRIIGTRDLKFNGREIVIKGSVISSEGGELSFASEQFKHYPSQLNYRSKNLVTNQEYGITWKGGIGIDYGQDISQEKRYGYRLSHGLISGKKIYINSEISSYVSSPIVGEKIEINSGNLFLESLGEAEHIYHKKQGYRFGVSVGSDGISPGGGFNYGRGRGLKYWIELPAVIKGDELSIAVENKLTLIGGGLIGKESNIKAKVLELTKISIYNQYHYTQGGFNLNSLKDLYLGKLSRSIIKGWGEFGHEKLNQQGTVHPTITGLSEDNAAKLKSITDNWEILNTVAEKQIVSSKKRSQVYSIALPILNTAELKRRKDKYLASKAKPLTKEDITIIKQDLLPEIFKEAFNKNKDLVPEQVSELLDSGTMLSLEIEDEKQIVNPKDKLKDKAKELWGKALKIYEAYNADQVLMQEVSSKEALAFALSCSYRNAIYVMQGANLLMYLVGDTLKQYVIDPVSYGWVFSQGVFKEFGITILSTPMELISSGTVYALNKLSTFRVNSADYVTDKVTTLLNKLPVEIFSEDIEVIRAFSGNVFDLALVKGVSKGVKLASQLEVLPSRGSGSLSKQWGRVSIESLEKVANKNKKTVITDGVVYRRSNPINEENYIGQAKSYKRYLKRQKEHDRALKIKHKYDVLHKNIEGKDRLDYLEEKMIREKGGLQKEGGSLLNKRHQVNEQRYNELSKKFENEMKKEG